MACGERSNPFLTLMGIVVFIFPRAARFCRVPSLGGCGEYHANIVLQWDGVWRDTLAGLEPLALETRITHAASLGIARVPLSEFLDKFGYAVWAPNVGHHETRILIFAAYNAACVMLTVLVMLSLQSLPSGVYGTVAWTKFIPHWF
ncbi:hypothetical protein F4604DRAFT_1771149 [Suillus subluteus]|nr:hypothetical protein F4604DRAFT_1771149 [Suillus subluteus]